MEIPDIGEVITPIDDPCQYSPAWRSIIANYLVSIGVRGRRDLESISKTGGITVIVPSKGKAVTVTDESSKNGVTVTKFGPGKKRDKAAKAKKKGKAEANKEPATDKVIISVEPFNRHPEYRAFAIDPWIGMLVDLQVISSSGQPTPNELIHIKMATRYYEEPETEAAMRKRIEPLLLTDATMDIIAQDLLGTASTQCIFEAYEKLYFNCRDDKFILNPSMQLIQRFAMPWGPLKTFMRRDEEIDEDGFVIGDGRPLAKDSDVWRAVAATMGYEALMYVWRWNTRAHGMKDNSMEHMLELAWKASVSQLIAQLYTGDVRHEDAARLLSAFTAQSKKISDDRNVRHDSGEDDTTRALMAVLYKVSPKMVAFSDDDVKSRNDEIQSRIQSQLAINSQAIDDRGKQVEAEIIDAQISKAINVQ